MQILCKFHANFMQSLCSLCKVYANFMQGPHFLCSTPVGKFYANFMQNLYTLCTLCVSKNIYALYALGTLLMTVVVTVTVTAGRVIQVRAARDS